ncbi:hypothetical protein ABIE44_002022 [Marmoricola sp. OAE513]|uniref:hypothetical protein n=1 Tax=Marmoricola sp. OAE513 TaxID=2817894 RepID=UPI001AEAB959
MRAALVLVLAVVLTAAGCGSTEEPQSAESDAPRIDFLPGARVGELAEKQLEAEHAEMATGAVDCPDLEWEVDASVRCVKTSELSDGRRVRVPGTVTVTSTEGYGTLHVELDDAIAEFGVDGRHLADDVTTWVSRRVRGGPVLATCSYLVGKPGASSVCKVVVAGEHCRVRVSVTGVDAGDFRTRYRMDWKVRPKAA